MSLLKNIPLSEASDIAVNLIFENSSDQRYVDDTFAIFESQSDADAFYSHLDTRHENMKFNFEKEQENKLLILDIL